MKKKIILFCILAIVLILIPLFILLKKDAIFEKKYNSFNELLVKNDFEIIKEVEAGEKFTTESGFTYVINNKTTDYSKNKVDISIVEVTNIDDITEELDAYYNFYNSDNTKVEKEEKQYVSLKFIDDNKYNCLIGIDKYLIYINTYKGNYEEETYDMLIEFINYKYPENTEK